MTTRDQLNTDISIEILAELQKASEPQSQPQQLTKEQKRFNALQDLMGSANKAKRQQMSDLQDVYKAKRHV